jgi:Mrp family chromosome partitioning ATPase
MKKVLADLTQQTDLVIIDSPPVLAVADAAILASYVDGVVLVLRSGETATRSARHGLETLRQTRANVLGAVLNGVPPHDHGYYRYERKPAERANPFLRLWKTPDSLSRRLGRRRGQSPALRTGEPRPLHSQRS